MKLKRCIASATALAMTVSVMAFAPMTAEAAPVDRPNGTESVIKTFSIDGNPVMSQYASCWVSLYGIDESSFTSANYVKVTMDFDTAPEIGDGKNKMSEVAGWGWGSYSGWYNAGQFYDGTIKSSKNLVPATSSKDKEYYCYLPVSDFKVDDHIAGNVQNYIAVTATLKSVELVEISSFSAPTLPAYKYDFDQSSGSCGAWGQAAFTEVGTDKTVTPEVLAGNSVIAVKYTSSDRPDLVLSDSKGDTSPLNWIKVKPDGVADGVAYYMMADMAAAWTAAGGSTDFSDVAKLFVSAGANDLTVSSASVYSNCSKIKTITPVVTLPDSITVYTTDTDAQVKLIKGAVKVSGIDMLTSDDYTLTVSSDGAAGVAAFALTTVGKAKYELSADAVTTATCVINFEAWKPTFYDDYTVSGPMTIDVDYNSDASAVSSAITAAIGSQTITMELIASEGDHAPLPAKAIEDVMTSIVLPDSYDADSTVSVPVTIGLSNVMNEGDVYYPNYTLGASGEAASSVTVTYTVNIGSDSSKPDPNPNPNPDPDPKPNPDPEPTPNPVPTGYNGDGTDPTAKYPSNGSTDCAASRYAGGNAYSSARAGYAIRQAASGSEVVIIMESDDIILRRVLELLAQKDNVNATFVYSGYSVTINSDDIDADEVTDIDLSNKGKFLTADELAMFDGAIEVRQLNLSAFKGIAKVQITMTMTGASKGADGTALDRTSEGQFRFISDGSVGDDRTFSFEITEGGKYVVYTGDCDVEVYEQFRW